MALPAILGLATGVPTRRFTQAEICAWVQPLLTGSRRAPALFRAAQISTRHLAVGGEFYAEERRTEARNDRYLAEAVPLGEQTILRCLADAGASPADLDYLVVVSCTGIDIPGLDLLLARRLGLRHDLRRTCVLGMGCYAAFPGLQRAVDAVQARPGTLALVLALELCSLHMQPGEATIENMTVAALFADGAAAMLIGDSEAPRPAAASAAPSAAPAAAAAASAAASATADAAPVPCVVDSATHCDYTTLDRMAFHLTDYGFHMELSAYVPELLAADVEGFVDNLLRRNGLTRSGVRFWGIHPGGARILDHLQARLGLTAQDMSYSRRVLRDYGNMSSPTILFVLDAIRRSGDVRPGDYSVLLSFGPGLTIEGALLRW